MESSKSATSGIGKTAVGRSKIPGLPASTRLQRNLAEKERRDKLNGFISELATLIPMVSNASKPLDKVSILRLAAAEMRLHFNVFCSRSIEDYLGYQNIDVMGHKVGKYIYENDVKFFESQVNSVVRSLKRAHKKTKVIKAHMLQKPLPRSTETCRPRNMIFKISVHQNDTSGENGHSNNGSSHPAKTRPQKDFGYSAVVLLFIEPVRFEPEIDITYIDSNQDVYFTRHGLQGEIIYADQHISTITGYMPHDVQGTSAYQYICSSDVPIALFAQKAMFTSPDGKGVIVYRLRIRDMRYIYLQSSGQIVYKESSTEISHFVCFNRLLSEEEGSQELKKFQQRYAPQIMAAKMLQVSQNPGSASPTTDLAFEQVMNLINNSPTTDAPSTSAQTYACSSISSPDSCPGISDQKQSKTVETPSSFPMEPNFVHSSEGHSTNSSIDTARPTSITLNCTPMYVNEEHIDALLEEPEKRLGGGPLRRIDCSSTLSSSPYKTMSNDKKGKILAPEQCRNSANKLDPAVVSDKFCNSVNNPGINDGTNRIHRNRQYISIKSQNGTVHFVNVNNNLYNGANVDGTSEVHNNQSMVFDPTLPQKITFQLAASVAGQSNSQMTNGNEELSDYLRRKEPMSRNISQIPGSIESVPSMLCDQLNFNEEQGHASQVSHFEDTLSFSQMDDAFSSVSSLPKNSNVSVHSDLYNGIDYNHNLNLYPEMDSYSNYHSTSNISSYSNDANVSAYNDLENFNSKHFNCSGMNGFHETLAPLEEMKTVSPMEIFDSTKVSIDNTAICFTPQNTAPNKAIFMDVNNSSPENDKTLTVVNQNSILNALLASGQKFSDSVDWDEILSSGPTGSEELPLNKELYNELESFFHSTPTSTVLEDISKFPLDISNFKQSSISPETKTIYQQ